MEELALTKENVNELSIVVCGSAHVKRNKSRRNVSTTLVPGSEPKEHYKFNAFEFQETRKATTARYREDIATTPSVITVDMGTNWSFSTLICKDFLEDSVPELLEQLRVRLVLLPSCSAKTDQFEANIARLAGNAQTVVIFANLVDKSHSAASAIIGRPRQNKLRETISRSEVAPPGLLLTLE